jgi:hypothetical protein
LSKVDNGICVGEGELTPACCAQVNIRQQLQERPSEKSDLRSVASHFMLFSFVTWPKLFLAMVVNWLLLR